MNKGSLDRDASGALADPGISETEAEDSEAVSDRWAQAQQLAIIPTITTRIAMRKDKKPVDPSEDLLASLSENQVRCSPDWYSEHRHSRNAV